MSEHLSLTYKRLSTSKCQTLGLVRRRRSTLGAEVPASFPMGRICSCRLCLFLRAFPGTDCEHLLLNWICATHPHRIPDAVTLSRMLHSISLQSLCQLTQLAVIIF